MSDKRLADKVEESVTGIKDFAVRFLLTVRHLATRNPGLLESCEHWTPGGRYLGPNAFLLIAAILLGVFGSILLGGLANIGIGTLFTLNELSLTSFLHLSLPLFIVAIFAGLLVTVLWRTAASEKRDAIMALIYYVIGYTSLAAILTLVALAGFLAAVDVYVSQAVALFQFLGYGTISLFLLHAVWILFRGILDILSGSEAVSTSAAKALVVSVATVALSGANFLYSHQQDPLTANLMDIERRDDGSTVLTYAVSNTTSKTLAINLVDSLSVIATAEDGAAEESQGYWSEGCALAIESPFFQLIEPGRSEVLTTYVCDPAFSEFLESHNYVSSDRATGRQRVYANTSTVVTFEIRARVFNGAKTEPKSLYL